MAQLKQILEQQANNFKESLKKHNLQSNKEKEKLLQDLQNSIKENQNVKLQLEASHQKVLKMLEKSKNQELKVSLLHSIVNKFIYIYGVNHLSESQLSNGELLLLHIMNYSVILKPHHQAGRYGLVSGL